MIPPEYVWRASSLPSLKKIQILEGPGFKNIGSIGPTKKGKWINRESGQIFEDINEAKLDVENYVEK